MRRSALKRDAALYFVGKASAAAGVFAAIPLATRGVGTHEFASFALWSAVALWASTAAIGWLQTGVQRFHRERRLGDGFPDYVASVRQACRWGGLVSALLVILAATFFSRLPAAGILAIALLAAANAGYIAKQALAQADLAAPRVVAADIVRGIVLPGALIVFLAFGIASVAGLAMSHSLGLFAATIVLSRGSDLPTSGRLRIEELRALWRYGAPVGLWLVASLASTQVGRLMLELRGTSEQLAAYAATHEVIIKAGTLVLMPIVYAAQAHVMASWADGARARVRDSLRSAILLQCVAGLAIVAACSVGGDVLRAVLFPDAPIDGSIGLLAALLAAGVVLGNLGLLTHKGLELGQRTRTMLALAVVALGSNALLCVALVPVMGAMGAAVAYAVAQAVYALAAHMHARPLLARLRA